MCLHYRQQIISAYAMVLSCQRWSYQDCAHQKFMKRIFGVEQQAN